MAGPLITVSPSGKSIALQDLPDSAWRVVGGKLGDQDGSVTDVYSVVPWVYRGVNIRAQGISKTPIAILRGETEIWTTDDDNAPPKGFEWFSKLPALIDRCERSLCLDGAAYLMRERNQVRTLALKFMLPRTITPKFDVDKGLIGFDRTIGNGVPKPLEVADVVYCWLPSVTAELGPGTSPVAAALAAAGLMKRIDLFASGFFDRGATPLTILSVEGNPAAAELRRLEQWWKRALAGVKRAFETVAVKASIKPQVIGFPPKDLAMPELTNHKRQDIATCLGIPYSILFSEATNLATAKMDQLNLWDLTLRPQAEMIEDILNEQLFVPLGFRMEFQFKKLEVYQAREAEKAFALLALVQGGVWTPNELREQMDLEPRSDGDNLQNPAAMIDKQSAAEMSSETAERNGARPNVPGQQRKALELQQWQRKALKALKAGEPADVSFKFEHHGVDDGHVASIRYRLSTATSPEEVKAAFSAAPFLVSYP